MKTCTAGRFCYYACYCQATSGHNFRECSYIGYCDYQLPKDSRKLDRVEPELPNLGKAVGGAQ